MVKHVYGKDNQGFSSEMEPITLDSRNLDAHPKCSSLPIPSLIEDLRTRAQTSQSTVLEPMSINYSQHHIFLPDLHSHHHHHHRAPQEPFCGNSSISDPGFDSGCSTHLLGLNNKKFCLQQCVRSKSHQQFCKGLSITRSRHWRSCPSGRFICATLIFSCLTAALCAIVGVLTSSTLPCEEHTLTRGPTWWQNAVFYEIFPASFQDTDGDGFGDLRGIMDHLDYIRDLGASAIRLGSVFCALDYPLEYEHVIDFQNVDPHLGRMEDFHALVSEAHVRGLRVVLDLNPSVTSDQHTWALHWQRGIPGYQHYYASANRSKAPPEMEDTDGPPESEWQLPQRTFGGHYFLNWSNPSVQREFQEMMDFWFECGVDGFYLKHLEKLHVRSDIDLYLVLSEWRRRFDLVREETNLPRVLIATMKFAKDLRQFSAVADMVLEQVDLLDVPVHVDANFSEDVSRQIEEVKVSRNRTPSLPWIMWHLGNAETFRLGSRLEPALQTAALFLLLMLPGPVSVFYGDEIGLQDSYDVITGKVFRGGQLTLMQWSNQGSGNFTENGTLPWLPLHPNHETMNTVVQSDRIHLLGQLTKHRCRSKEWEAPVPQVDPAIVILQRICEAPNQSQIFFAANFGRTPQKRDFSPFFPPLSPRRPKVLLTTPSDSRVDFPHNVTLNTGEAIIAQITI